MSFQSLSSNHCANCNYDCIFFSLLPAHLKPLIACWQTEAAWEQSQDYTCARSGGGALWGRAQVCRSCKYRCVRQVRDLTAGFACRLASSIHHARPLLTSASPLSHSQPLAPPPNKDTNCIELPSQVHNRPSAGPDRVWIPPS